MSEPSFRRIIRAARIASEGKCYACEMDYGPRIADLERSLHIARVALDVKEQLNEALRKNHDEQKAKIQKLREALLACVGLLKAFIGPDDELGQAHISMAKEALR